MSKKQPKIECAVCGREITKGQPFINHLAMHTRKSIVPMEAEDLQKMKDGTQQRQLIFDPKTGELQYAPLEFNPVTGAFGRPDRVSEESDAVVVDQIYKTGFFNQEVQTRIYRRVAAH